MSYYTIFNLPEKYLKTENIPPSDVSDLPDDERNRYDKLYKGIVEYLRTKSLKAGAEEACCSSSEMLRQYRRLATMVGDGEIVGFPALKHYRRLKAYKLSPENTSKSPVGRSIGRGFMETTRWVGRVRENDGEYKVSGMGSFRRFAFAFGSGRRCAPEHSHSECDRKRL